MSSENKKLIVVLGMHRSGTSVITRGLQVLGIGLGDNLIPPIIGDNDKGFYEDIDLNTLNEEILAFIHRKWSDLSSFDTEYVDCLRQKGYFDRAVELIQKKMEGTFVFGIKDPRVARLLAFWKEVFLHCQLDVHYVLAIRHPLSVASSLNKRDNFTLEHGFLLWLCYVYESLKHSIGCNRIVVDYDHLMQSADSELERIGQAIAQDIDLNEMRQYKETFLEQRLRHTVYNLDSLQDNICPSVVREIYNDLLMLARDRAPIDDTKLQNKLTLWGKEIEKFYFSFTLADKLISREAIALQTITEYKNQIEDLNCQLAERGARVTNLTNTITEYETHTANLLQLVTEREGQVTNLTQAIVGHEAQAASLTELVDKRETEIARISEVVAEYETHTTNLTQLVAERDTQITHLNQVVAEYDIHTTNLTQLVAERDTQITHLNQVVAEYNIHTTNLTQLVAERDTHAANLSHAVTQREMQVAHLSQVVTEYDSHITNLTQLVAQRDALVTALTQNVAERDALVTALTQNVAEREAQVINLSQELNKTLKSKSWVITKPLRFISRFLVWPIKGSS
ncbi:chromosome segregation protein SMC [Legionella massiliensis]|uniref:Chromosome segregation protein SMC n=1 Tax=Legionella massiliensis TaxID=1034943 RepID=A0A078KWX1_9GAMM|nr:sulfotransferase family protein [Legionella massiliensis]CDZ76233.1 chromosome segregation protein SMC [Legionella massiliensis]CEE11971.1 Chromosome partition protein Smc [Legionella massiliensis]